VPEGLRRIKETEKRWYERFIQGFASVVDIARVGIRRFFAWGRTRFVFAVIPQSEKPARRFETSRFSLIVMGAVLILFVGFAVYSLSTYSATALKVTALEVQLTRARQNIDQMRESTENLLSETAKFQEKLDLLVNIAQSKDKPDPQQNTSDILKTAGLIDLVSGTCRMTS